MSRLEIFYSMSLDDVTTSITAQYTLRLERSGAIGMKTIRSNFNGSLQDEILWYFITIKSAL